MVVASACENKSRHVVANFVAGICMALGVAVRGPIRAHDLIVDVGVAERVVGLALLVVLAGAMGARRGISVSRG